MLYQQRNTSGLISAELTCFFVFFLSKQTLLRTVHKTETKLQTSQWAPRTSLSPGCAANTSLTTTSAFYYYCFFSLLSSPIHVFPSFTLSLSFLVTLNLADGFNTRWKDVERRYNYALMLNLYYKKECGGND